MSSVAVRLQLHWQYDKVAETVVTYTVSKMRKNIYMSVVQVTGPLFEMKLHFLSTVTLSGFQSSRSQLFTRLRQFWQVLGIANCLIFFNWLCKSPSGSVSFPANINWVEVFIMHEGDVIMGAIASQITSLAIVYSTVYSDADQRKHQSSASLAFVWIIHRGPVNSPHKLPVTRKMFPFDDVIMANFFVPGRDASYCVPP